MKLPGYLARYFWGDNLEELSLRKHRRYIVTTLLEKGDQRTLRWLFKKIFSCRVAQLLPQLKFSPKSANFWQILLKRNLRISYSIK